LGFCAFLTRETSVRRGRATRLLKAAADSLILLLLLTQVVRAQQFTFHKYGQQDGLSNLSVSSLYQDHAGYVWVGTENGLFRHDSTGFVRFGDAEGLEDTAIHSTIEDPSGRLWVGTSHDLYVQDGQHFRAVRPDGRELTVGSGARLYGIAPNRLLVVDKEELAEIWSMPGSETWHRRDYFKPEQLHTLPQLARINSVYVDQHDRIWLGCGEQICRVEHGHVDTWDAKSGVPKDAWRTWLLDSDGRIWGRGLQHVVVLKPGASAFEVRDGPHSKLTAGILNVPLIEDYQGRIITRSDLGLMRWQTDHWQEFTGDNGITTPEISALLATRDGSVWLGMSGHGLWRWLGYETFESWTASRDANTNPVWDVLRGPDQAIMIATRSGCQQIDELTSLMRSCRIEGLPPGEIQVMTKRADGSLWFGLSTGELLRVAFRHRHADLVKSIPFTRKLFADSSDRLWICSNDGIFVIPAGSTRVESTAAPEGLGEITDAAEDDEGTLWFATQRGLLRWAQDKWSLLLLDAPVRDGFASVTPVGHGWLWAGGATHGLMHLHVTGEHSDHAEWIAEAGMSSAAVYFTQTDSRGWLWVGTDEGFSLFDGRVWRKFTQADGLIWNDTEENSAFSDADGTMWIGTSGGLTHVIRPENLIQSAPLDLRIAAATLGRTELDPDANTSLKWLPHPALDVRLVALDFVEPNQTVLNVRLRGLSDDWFQTHDFNMHYPGLAPGRYTLEAYAVDAGHQRSSRPVSLSFQILPPWWQATWFKALVMGGILLGLTAAWRWSVRRLDARRWALERELKEREALLERATRDPLTKLWNRQAILEILSREIETARRSATPLAIALIDLDHFKGINDTLGHLAGDEVLRVLGAQLSGRLRARDSLGRYGGEELLLVIPEASPQRPFLPMERLQRLISEIPFAYNGATIHVTASFGVAWLTPSTDSVEGLLRRADEALYSAKFSGRDRVEYAATGS
jgi:diguanylate cyclase (GGDEF)-like protein